MSDLTFYTHPMSRGRIIRWMLEEVGAPYDTRIIGFDSDMKAGEYKAINPMGKVPAIKHGDVVVTECAAICAYLADAFPERVLPLPPTIVAFTIAGSSLRPDLWKWASATVPWVW